MSRNVIETVMGAVVLLVAALFLFFAYRTSQIHAARGYELTARFQRVDGIREGSDVRLSGIKVGSVVGEALDPKTFEALVKLSIDPTIKLPKDTTAQIASAGLLGDKYMSLVPGVEDDTIPPGGQITRTEPGFTLESLLGQFIFSVGQGAKKGEGEQGGGEATPGGGASPGSAAIPGGTNPGGGATKQ
jgi:phospholipid/cholesterol/gamma-HCH transport system substrate-binding protein